MLYIIIGVLVVIIILLVIALIYAINFKNKIYETKLESAEIKYLELDEKCTYFEKQYRKLQEEFYKKEEKKSEKVKVVDTPSTKIKKLSTYKGKKALVGDYTVSAEFTKTALESFGFRVDIAKTVEEVIARVKFEENYDIIFSNNVYPNGGSGAMCLEMLRDLENFSTPVVIHTVDQNKRDYFVNYEGFDEYIAKPVTQDKLKPILNKLLGKKK